jgi:hypothetical protein
VWFDGAEVWLDRDATTPPSHGDLELLRRVHAASAGLEDIVHSRLRDRFLWKALVVEGVVWSIAGYAIGAVVELAVRKEDYHLDASAVAWTGLAAAGVALAVLLAVIALALRGSSRGHRIIVESAIVLLLGLPTTAIQVVGDTNRALDDAPGIRFARVVAECEVQVHTGRRGRKSYSYHLHLRPPGAALSDDERRVLDELELPPGVVVPPPEAPRGGPELPGDIEITRELCDVAHAGATVELELGPGLCGLPWNRRIAIGSTAWTP